MTRNFENGFSLAWWRGRIVHLSGLKIMKEGITSKKNNVAE